MILLLILCTVQCIINNYDDCSSRFISYIHYRVNPGYEVSTKPVFLLYFSASHMKFLATYKDGD
jgi:hypothetical protein